MLNKVIKRFAHIQAHSYHMVTASPWPLMASFFSLTLTVGGVMYMHGFSQGFLTLVIGFVGAILVAVFWWRDVIREATFEGVHTSYVEYGLRLGMVLFITSEVMFFFAFFWAFFHSSLVPTVEIGTIWPPRGLVVFDPQGVPLLNTLILLLSGLTITYTHHYLVSGNSVRVREGFIATIGLAIAFTLLQYMEYVQAPFTISDSVYGSTFFMATGFHGVHVIIGTTFIIVCFFRAYASQFTKEHHFGFEAAAWYWHFVDVVWLFLFVSVYWWGGADFGQVL